MEPTNDLLDDKSRFIAVMNILSEKFVDDWVNFYLWNANYPTEYNETIGQYDDYRNKIMSEFYDLKINTAHKKLNESFADLEKFLNLHFSIPQVHYKMYKNPPYYFLETRIHHNFRLSEGGLDSSVSKKQDSERWNKYKEELDKLAKNFELAYKNFIMTAKKETGTADSQKSLIQKISIGSQTISFDDNKPSIIIGDKECRLPPFKNEHYFCRAIFRYPAREPVDWSIIFEGMDKTLNSATKKNSTKDKRMIQDMVYAINKRVKEVINTDDNLFIWQEKSIRRNH